MSQRRPLFTVRESANFPRELWDRFVARTRDEGRSPVAVLRALIERYLSRPTRHDTQTDKPEQ